MLTVTALGLAASVLSIAACTHTTDRVLEPVGAGDASAPTPELSDGGLSPLTPIALPPGTPAADDYRLVRAPEFGEETPISQAEFTLTQSHLTAAGGVGASGGGGGMAGSDSRPVAAGGSYH